MNYKRRALLAHKDLVKRLHKDCFNSNIPLHIKDVLRANWINLYDNYVISGLSPTDIAISESTYMKVFTHISDKTQAALLNITEEYLS